MASELKPELLSNIPEAPKKPLSEPIKPETHLNGNANPIKVNILFCDFFSSWIELHFIFQLDEQVSDESNPLPPSNGHQLAIEDDSRDKSEDDVTNDSISTSESAQTPLVEALTEDSSSLPAPDEPPVKKFKNEGQTVAAEANGN